MTKPVQIQPVMRFTSLWGEQRMGAAPDGHWVQFPDAEAHEQAALLQVREMLEAKAKEWKAEEGYDSVGWRICGQELLELAATLGNQGK